jgi:uncharacterized protein (DUF924 family)
MWWAKDEKTDEYLRIKFESRLEDAKEGRLHEWDNTPRGTLALIILFDQLSRNTYRDTPRAFSKDRQALEHAMNGIEKGVR